MAFRGFGQFDLVATLAKTGISTASKGITDNPALQSIMSSTGQVVAVEAGILSPNVFLAAPVAMALAAWIGGFIESLPWRPGPVDDPIYIKIYNDGMDRVARLKSWGLTVREIEELTWKIGMFPLEYNKYVGSVGDVSYLATGAYYNYNMSDFEIIGIYLPIEKAYLDAAASNYFGYEYHLDWGRQYEYDPTGILTGNLFTIKDPGMIPPEVHISEPISNSIVQKLQSSGIPIVPVSTPTPTPTPIIVQPIVATAILTSEQVVTRDYQDVLSRNPNQEELSSWSQWLQGGNTEDGLRSTLLNTNEYKTLQSQGWIAKDTRTSPTTTSAASMVAGFPTWAIVLLAGLGVSLIFGSRKGIKRRKG